MNFRVFVGAILASTVGAYNLPPRLLAASLPSVRPLAARHSDVVGVSTKLSTGAAALPTHAVPSAGHLPSMYRSGPSSFASSTFSHQKPHHSTKSSSDSTAPSSVPPTLLSHGSPLPSTPSPPYSNFTGKGWGKGDKQLKPPNSHFSHFDCGTHVGTASDHFLNMVHHLHTSTEHTSISSLAGFGARRAVQKRVATISISLYIHVVSTQVNSGTITPAMVANQVAAMNSAYRSHGITFVLQGSDITINNVWAVGASSNDDMAMKTALRKGTYSTLNLYMQTDLAGGILGRCTLPTDIGSNPTNLSYIVDGCNIAAGTMPGGVIQGFNMGMTAVHETGHWLGLLHTFEGYSCSGNGDFVADTPAEAESTNGCPSKPWKNTCSNRSGFDPIHNYMDYSTDACYIRFTPGQEQRMKSLWPTYRAGR